MTVSVQLANNGGFEPFQKQINEMHTNSSILRYDEWRKIDERVLATAREKINAIDDLKSAGLQVNLGGVGVNVSSIPRSGETTEAKVNMDPETKTQNDKIKFDIINFPVPLFIKDFCLNGRTLASSGGRGESLQTTQVREATVAMKLKMEGMAFNGLPEVKFGADTIYGYTTHPDRIPHTLTSSWETADGVTIISDITAMVKKAKSVRRYGPFVLYIPCNVWTSLDEDYSTLKSDRTTLERMKALSSIADVKEGFTLAPDQVVLVEMNDSTVDLAIAQDMLTLEVNPGIHPLAGKPIEFRLISAMVMRLKSDMNGSMGLVHGSL